MDWLKKILEGAKVSNEGVLDVDALVASINTEMPKHMVPKTTFNDTNDQLKAANDTIKDLKKSNKDNEELQNKIAAHEDTIQKLKEDSEAQISKLKIDNALNALLVKSKAKYPELLLGKFDRTKITIKEDGKTIDGAEDQLKNMKETYKDQFGATVSGNPPANPEQGGGDPTDMKSALAKHYS